jgi:predicted DCC family thiol-disulfide oxidoreductase YuxK
MVMVMIAVLGVSWARMTGAIRRRPVIPGPWAGRWRVGDLGADHGRIEFDSIWSQTDTAVVIVHGTDEFERWLDHVEDEGGELCVVALAVLQALVDLPEKPAVESATFKRVRQARRHELWRVAHPNRGGGGGSGDLLVSGRRECGRRVARVRQEGDR